MNSEPDFSSVAVPASTSVLDNITGLVRTLRTWKREIDRLTKELEDATAVHSRMVQVDIPDAMQLASLTELKLSDGAVLKVRDDINVNINEANRPTAFAWLREAGFGALIKSEMVIDLRSLEEESVSHLLQLCVDEEIETTAKESIHAATLKSSVKDMLAKGLSLPPSISVHQYKKAELKEPKEPK